VVRVPKFERPGVWPPFPSDPRNGRGWDDFWRAILTSAPLRPDELDSAGAGSEAPRRVRQWLDEFYAEPLAALRMDCADHRYRAHLDTFISLGLQRVLCAGNGISVLPYMFAHRGFGVAAVDVSNAATEFARAHPPEEKYFLRFFTLGLRLSEPVADSAAPPGDRRTASATRRSHRLEQMRQAIQEAHRPGGGLDFTTSDLFSYEPGEGSFGAAILQNVAEHFPRADRELLAGRLYRWLAPGSVLVVESQHLSVLDPDGRALRGIEEAFEAAGFLFHLKEAYLWQREQKRVAWWQIPKAARLSSRGYRDQIQEEFGRRAEVLRATDYSQVRQGRKMVIFQYGR
jgi:hypothetical protein